MHNNFNWLQALPKKVQFKRRKFLKVILGSIIHYQLYILQSSFWIKPALPNILTQNPWKLLSKWECQKA